MKFIVKESVENAVLEPGDYVGEIKKVSAGLVQSGKYTGNEKLEISWRVDNKATVKDVLIIAEAFEWKLSKFVLATKIAKAGAEVELEPDKLVGLTATLTLTKEEVESKGNKITVNRISNMRPAVVDDFLDDL